MASLRLLLGADADSDLFQLGFMDALGPLRDEFVLDSCLSGVCRGASDTALALEASQCWDNDDIPRHTSLQPSDDMDVELLLVHDESALPGDASLRRVDHGDVDDGHFGSYPRRVNYAVNRPV
ncbi:hypothetical protein BDZ89DRAFT_356649 [Hymenopellis radicata]|nr:hypothetical protein BDZ89DRAFT_356649 [Hymenopellis radicata]